ncbi:LOW QUALITY PROTEIN: aladin-like [Pecten maximus]|uniref:LOW QUALITY PROTEIN: aladin-like n=1 Tax=Pecten maximus TaxID=6579 RepID=UPI001458A9E4|nr:LOW QUALITY PROTEIN: aladin-like [Pecten maximus]
MSGSIFTIFPPVPAEDSITLCEQNGQMVNVRSDGRVPAANRLPGYPDVTIPKDTTKSLSQRENAKSAFLSHDETVWKRAMHAWYEIGLSGVFEEIVNSQDEVPKWAAAMARSTLTFVRGTNSLHGSLFPHLSMSNEDIIRKFTHMVEWASSPVRAFAWHPHTTKFAYAMEDDSIKVHMARNELVPTLKHKLQKNVSDLAWRPQSASVLAVACQSCILIWQVEPTSLATRPSTSSVQVLQQSNHAPVTSLSWDPNGCVLLSASPVDTAILAWDVPMETCIPLRRGGGGGVSMVSWSPDGSKVFTATPSNVFRVWETTRWSCEKWTKCLGRCKAACWSPDGSVLLFTTEREQIIYSLTFSTSRNDRGIVIGGSQSAVASVDLSEVEVKTEDNEDVEIGGLVHNMVWDSNGERLAVLLGGGKNTKRMVVLFRTKVSPLLEVTPCGYIRGDNCGIPYHISFQPNYDNGALLTVVWSTGSVGYVPLYFVASDVVEYHRFQQNAPMLNGQILSPIQSVS